MTLPGAALEILNERFRAVRDHVGTRRRVLVRDGRAGAPALKRERELYAARRTRGAHSLAQDHCMILEVTAEISVFNDRAPTPARMRPRQGPVRGAGSAAPGVAQRRRRALEAKPGVRTKLVQ